MLSVAKHNDMKRESDAGDSAQKPP